MRNRALSVSALNRNVLMRSARHALTLSSCGGAIASITAGVMTDVALAWIGLFAFAATAAGSFAFQSLKACDAHTRHYLGIG
jgi:hypothetical protein